MGIEYKRNILLKKATANFVIMIITITFNYEQASKYNN